MWDFCLLSEMKWINISVRKHFIWIFRVKNMLIFKMWIIKYSSFLRTTHCVSNIELLMQFAQLPKMNASCFFECPKKPSQPIKCLVFKQIWLNQGQKNTPNLVFNCLKKKRNNGTETEFKLNCITGSKNYRQKWLN